MQREKVKAGQLRQPEDFSLRKAVYDQGYIDGQSSVPRILEKLIQERLVTEEDSIESN